MHVFGFMSPAGKSIASSQMAATIPALSSAAALRAPDQAGRVSEPALAAPTVEERDQTQGTKQRTAPDPVQIYETDWVPALFGTWASATIATVRPKPGDAVLDVACGTGVVARLAARDTGITGRVVGLDLNREMLSVAGRQSTAAEDLSSATIEWRHADACALPFPDASFNVAYCQFGLPFFSDRSAALQEMRRVLVPGAQVALTVWQPIEKSPGFAILARVLEDCVGAAQAQIVRAAYDVSDSAELRAMFAIAQFNDVSIESRAATAQFRSVGHLLNACLAGSRLGEAVARVEDSVRRKLIADLCARLSTYVSPQGLAFPVEAFLVRARR